MTGPTTSGGFGVYVHWPFCAQKCPYCDFNSHVRHGGWDEAAYLAAYLRELETAAATSDTARVDSIFFGGGTPSLMQAATVEAIIEAVDRRLGLAADAEITLEANPGSVDAKRFRGYRAAGVNRVSLGLQALDDDELKRLGRIHTGAEALAALDIAKATFDRVSFDLIYARPGMTERKWEAELARALQMQAGHLSLYQLTIEDGTPFAALHRAGKLIVPEPELADRLYGLTQEMCEAAGLPAYEISNHARPGNESRHNLVYWRYGRYLGLGPGAHGRESRGGERSATANEKAPEAWLHRVMESGRGIVEQSRLSAGEQADEMLLMGLRLQEGVDLGRLAAVSGLVPGRRAVEKLASLGMIEVSGGAEPRASADAPAHARGSRLRATRQGRFVLNEVVRQLAMTFERA